MKHFVFVINLFALFAPLSWGFQCVSKSADLEGHFFCFKEKTGYGLSGRTPLYCYYCHSATAAPSVLQR